LWWAIAVLLFAAGCIGGSGWLGAQLILNPQRLIWINQILPDWIPISVTGLQPPQTLSQIREAIQRTGRTPGELLPLGQNVSFLDNKSAVSDVLLPVLGRQPNCQVNCEKIVELRVYQSTLARSQQGNWEPYYQLVNQQAIAGPEESFAIAPLVDAQSANQGSARSLPLSELKPFADNVPAGGVWFNLIGKWVRGDGTVLYGQIFHYNPKRFHLGMMLEWSSPAGKEPIWQEISGGGLPELVVDQTIGIEPQFRVYQVQLVQFLPNPLRLQSISLYESPITDRTYDNALLLARSRLWSTAEQWLLSLKRTTNRKAWSALAQAQLDLVQLHARITRTQAEQSWASPAQQMLANLIDGRWARALQVFEASAENSREMAGLLRADNGQLQDRVEAVLRLSPAQLEPKAWRALLIAAQRDRASAIAWVRKQPKTTPANIARIDALLRRLDESYSDSQPAPAFAPGYLAGAAQVVSNINPADWLKPKSVPGLKLDKSQVWYRVQVTGFHDGKHWRLAESGLGLPANASAETLWKTLGLTSDPSLQILFWLPNGEQHPAFASIQAVRWQAGTLELLAAGEPPPKTVKPSSRPRPLAFTDSALPWLSPGNTFLSDLVQQETAWAKVAIPTLVQELQTANHLPSDITPTWAVLEELGAGNWQVQRVALTSTNKLDVVLTLYPEMLQALQPTSSTIKPPARTRTLIFSAAGELLYSEFSTDKEQLFLAIVDLGDPLPALVLDTPDNYAFRRWSSKKSQFE
jgi:hypothetical protein